MEGRAEVSVPAGAEAHFSRGGHQAELITHSAWARLKIHGLKSLRMHLSVEARARVCDCVCACQGNRKPEHRRKWL